MRTATGLVVVALTVVGSLPTLGNSGAQDKPVVQIPKSGVAQIMTMEGEFVRAAYNNEGYVILGYQLANRSIGVEWMLLEVGMTVLDRTPAFRLQRSALSIETPDGKTLPLPSTSDYSKANTAALRARESVQRDSINYFPPTASRACRIGFFADLETRAIAYDDVELSSSRACLGRLYFHVPGGITYGQHWLNVKFANSLVRVPFRILTKDEEKLLSRNYKDISKQVKDAFKPKK